MVAGYANSGKVSTAREIFDEMLKKNAMSWTAVIVGYGKCGDVRGARQVLYVYQEEWERAHGFRVTGV